MQSFAHNLEKFNHLCALKFSEREDISYCELAQMVDDFGKKIIGNRQLVLIEANKNVATIIAYLACLKYVHCALMIESDVNHTAKQQLIDTYRPNWHYFDDGSGYCLKRIHKTNLNLHIDLALLLSTSGSTGSPKLVKLSLRNLQSNAHSIVTYLGVDKKENAITSLPLSYSYGLSVLNSHLLAGASITVTKLSVLERGFWNLLKQKQVTSLSGVPYIYEILDKLKFTKMELPHLKTLTQAGGKLSADLRQTFATYAQQNKVNFYVMYGQTEATARITYLAPEKALIKSESIGQVIPGGQLWLEDNDGERITTTNKVGQLIYSGNNVMLGYANNLAELSDADQMLGRLPTGDLGYIDLDGDFTITGRKSRFIKIYGNRISLDDIEGYLLSQKIKCKAVGTDNVLYIVSEEGLEDAHVYKLLKDRYGFNKKVITLLSKFNLPRSSSGKILISELLKKAQNH